MTTAQLDSIIANSRHANYVPPVSHREVGWQLFVNGKPESDCTNAAQRDGWHAAWRYARRCLRQEWAEEYA